MDPRKLGLILVFVLAASLYLARRAGDLVEAYSLDREHKEMCAGVERLVLNGKLEQSSSSKLPLELAFAKKHCWKSKGV